MVMAQIKVTCGSCPKTISSPYGKRKLCPVTLEKYGSLGAKGKKLYRLAAIDPDKELLFCDYRFTGYVVNEKDFIKK
jgi:hypothetical protein